MYWRVPFVVRFSRGSILIVSIMIAIGILSISSGIYVTLLYSYQSLTSMIHMSQMRLYAESSFYTSVIYLSDIPELSEFDKDYLYDHSVQGFLAPHCDFPVYLFKYQSSLIAVIQMLEGRSIFLCNFHVKNSSFFIRNIRRL